LSLKGRECGHQTREGEGEPYTFYPNHPLPPPPRHNRVEPIGEEEQPHPSHAGRPKGTKNEPTHTIVESSVASKGGHPSRMKVHTEGEIPSPL